MISILQKSCQIGCLCRLFVNHNDTLSYISRENCGFGDFRILETPQWLHGYPSSSRCPWLDPSSSQTIALCINEILTIQRCVLFAGVNYWLETRGIYLLFNWQWEKDKRTAAEVCVPKFPSNLHDFPLVKMAFASLTLLLQWSPLSLLIILTALFTAALLALSFYLLFLHPLAKFPGPKLAAITILYEFYYDAIKRGQYTFKIGRMHEKYGA